MSFVTGSDAYSNYWRVEGRVGRGRIEVDFEDSECLASLTFTADQARELIEAIHNAIIEIQEEKK